MIHARVACIVAAALAVAACKKTPPEAHSAPSAVAADPVPATGAAPAGAKEDTVAPPGVDTSKLDDFERKVFFRIVNKEGSACGAAHSLIHSAKNDKACRKSYYAVRYVARLVDSGFTDTEIAESLQRRFRAGAGKTVDVAEAPMKGNVAARVTLVEFADYECPHCKRLQPVIRQVLDEYRNDVKLYFKHYPLPQHDRARLAAEAAVAAQMQGKFWPFEEKLWANQDSLGAAELEKYAKEVGIDMAKWRTDMESAAVRARVQKDRADGQGLGLSSTPTLYINGREYSDPRDVESLRDWLDEELNR